MTVGELQRLCATLPQEASVFLARHVASMTESATAIHVSSATVYEACTAEYTPTMGLVIETAQITETAGGLPIVGSVGIMMPSSPRKDIPC